MASSGGLPSVAEVLGVVLAAASAVFGRAVAETDNFFDLGGDSQNAVELGDRLTEKFRAELYMEVLLDADDMRGLAEGVVRSLAEESERSRSA
jgi:acyl carrier protein